MLHPMGGLPLLRPTDLGKINLVEHKIYLTDEHLFKEPIRKVPPALVEVAEHLKEMLEAGVIRESINHFSTHVCGDYHEERWDY